MALIAVVAPALYVVAVVGVLFVVNIYHRGDPDEDIEAVITRADDKAADSGESELQVGGDGQVGCRTKTFLFSSFLQVPRHFFVCLQESGVETHVKTMPEKVVEAGNPEGREEHHRLPDAGAALVAQRQEQRMGRNGSRGSGELEKFQITSAESDEARLGKGADSEARHINANAKPACGSDDESPRGPLQQKVHGKPSQKHDQVNSVSLDRLAEHLQTTLGASGVIQPANVETAIDVQTLLNQPTDERVVLHSRREEVIKSAMKFSYMSIGISGGALVTIFFGYYVNQWGRIHSFQLKICTLIMLASFVSGVSIPLLNFLQHHISVSLRLFRSLKCTAFALLVLALLDVSILFMKILALFAFVPTIAVVVIVYVIAFREAPTTSDDHHQQRTT
ncbi:uncharacterized protein LOC103989832 isoform X2 [Musa acuminata AAA Group]|uniref:uncharacterized protein LOC103989832 isoform X2 n=1 Tax=Musa acuminata AAA Group TaxID=214697 RepID=UPI0031D4589E